jgi:hypothetical protein
MSSDGLKISPMELKFRFELRKNIPVTLSLQNPGTERIGFKVKTTSPKKYCVRPSSGVIEPGATKDIQVIMQAQREAPSSLADCKDKFLVQSVIVDNAATDVTAEMFDPARGKEVKQVKLRVILVGPPKPPSPVPEGVEDDSMSPGRLAAKGENGSETAAVAQSRGLPPTGDSDSVREKNRLQEHLNKANREIQELKQKLSLLELQGNGRGQAKAQGFSLLNLFIVAIVAFITATIIMPRIFG